jgi:hypothetical protein
MNHLILIRFKIKVSYLNLFQTKTYDKIYLKAAAHGKNKIKDFKNATRKKSHKA